MVPGKTLRNPKHTTSHSQLHTLFHQNALLPQQSSLLQQALPGRQATTAKLQLNLTSLPTCNMNPCPQNLIIKPILEATMMLQAQQCTFMRQQAHTHVPNPL